MKHIKNLITIISILFITSCSETHNVDTSTFSTESQLSLDMATKSDLMQRSMDEVAIREINLWNKTILVAYPTLIFENGTTNFSPAAEPTIAKIIDQINSRENISHITVTSFGDDDNQQAHTIAAVIWDYAKLDDNIVISHNNTPSRSNHNASYVNRIEITLE